MKFGKWTVAVASLALCGLSTTAQAAKILTQTGTLAPDQYGNGYVDFDFSMPLPGFRTNGVRMQFSTPVSGYMSYSRDGIYYTYDRRGNLIDSNDAGWGFFTFITNTTAAKATARDLTPGNIPWYGGFQTFYTWFNGGGGVNVSGLTGAVDYKLTTFGAIPEPATWALMILGFGGIGTAMRRQKARLLSVA